MKNNNRNLFRIIKYLLSSFVAFSLGLTLVSSIITEANEKQNKYSLSQEELDEASRRAMKMKEYLSDDGFFIMNGDYTDNTNFDDINININELFSDVIESNDVEDVSNEIENSENEAVSNDDEYLNEDIFEEADVNEEVPESDSLNEDRTLPDSNDWRLILVNKQNPVPDGYEAELASIDGSQSADARIIDDIKLMMAAANEDGVNLLICSTYRSYDRQTTLFNNKMNKLMNQGMSYIEAYSVGSMSVTVPGTSEHQLGMALDILTSSYLEMDDGFGDTEAGIWLAANAPDYGFILRYPQGKEAITGIIYEPWHFRYVGVDYAREITELGVTLEEYLNGEY